MDECSSSDDGIIYVDPPPAEVEVTRTVFPNRTVAEECNRMQLRQIRGLIILAASVVVGIGFQGYISGDPATGALFITAGVLGIVTTITAGLRLRALRNLELEDHLDPVELENTRVLAGVWEFATVFTGVGMSIAITLDAPVLGLLGAAAGALLIGWEARSRRKAPKSHRSAGQMTGSTTETVGGGDTVVASARAAASVTGVDAGEVEIRLRAALSEISPEDVTGQFVADTAAKAARDLASGTE